MKHAIGETWVKVKAKGLTGKDIIKVNRVLRPFYYWIFDDIHMVMTGHPNYTDLTVDIEQIQKNQRIVVEEVHVIDVVKGIQHFRWDEI